MTKHTYIIAVLYKEGTTLVHKRAMDKIGYARVLDKMGHIMCFYVLKGLGHNRLLLLILIK